MIRFSRLRASFSAAAKGLSLIARQEQNFRIHLFIACLVLLTAWFLRLSGVRLALLYLAIGAVLACEILNTVVERMMDVLKARLSPSVAEIKDMMAGLVLVSAFCAAVVGVLVFFG